MAKAKGKSSKTNGKAYNPQAILDIDGRSMSDMEIARQYYKTQAGCGSGGGSTSYRQNIAYRGNDFDKYGAIQSNMLSPKEAIALSQTVYNNVGMVKHALDTMAEFTVSGIDFLSKKKAPREAMLGWAKGIRLKSFLDQVALEYYRSGNVYIYRFESRVKDASILELSNIMGLRISGSIKIPTQYTIINPTLINFVSSGLFDNQEYLVSIPGSETKMLIDKYKSDPEAFKDLPVEFAEAIRQYIGGKNNGKAANLIVKLNPDNVITIYRKKQPYESYAMPFLSGVFDDLEFRQELRNMDKALSRVISKILIHVAVGDDKHIPSPAALDAIRDKLSNPSTSTYLITDHTVNIKQYYPDIAQMLDPKKYEAVKNDIITALGISPAAYGDGQGSFANNFLGIKVLVERIIDGRTKILENFLIPESRRVAKAFNLKTLVTPEIVGVDLNDEKEWAKIVTRLYEDGVLSPQSAIEYIRDRRFPTYDEELERQQEAKALKDEGLFEPSANRGGDSQVSGRPEGGTTPVQTSPKKTTPVGTKGTILRSFTEDELNQAMTLGSKHMKEKLGLKKMDNAQKTVIKDACSTYLLENELSGDGLTSFLDSFVLNQKV